jgi:hypothetical protein
MICAGSLVQLDEIGNMTLVDELEAGSQVYDPIEDRQVSVQAIYSISSRDVLRDLWLVRSDRSWARWQEFDTCVLSGDQIVITTNTSSRLSVSTEVAARKIGIPYISRVSLYILQFRSNVNIVCSGVAISVKRRAQNGS